MTGSTAKPGIKGSITKEEALIIGADLQAAQSATRVQEPFAEMAPAPENYRMPIGTSTINEEQIGEAVPWPDDTDFDWIADLSIPLRKHLYSSLGIHHSVAMHALQAARHRAAHPEGLNPNHTLLQQDIRDSELSVARSRHLLEQLELIGDETR